MRTNFRGVFLTSDHPEQTAKFYLDVAGLELEQVGGGGYVYWRVDINGVQLAIHEAQKFADHAHPPRPESNVTHLYFKVDSQEKFLDHLAKLRVKPKTTDEVVVTVIDPDGRNVMFGTT